MRMFGDPCNGVFYTNCFNIGIPVDEKNINPRKQRKILKKDNIDLDKDGVYEQVCMQIVKSIQTKHNSRFISKNGAGYVIRFDDLEPANGGHAAECADPDSEKIDSSALEEQERSRSHRNGPFGKCKQRETKASKKYAAGKSME